MNFLKYKGIIFDEWTEDEYGTWVQICEYCLKNHGSVLDLEIDSHGGVGACSVKGCNNVGLDDNIEMTYLDLDINVVEYI